MAASDAKGSKGGLKLELYKKRFKEVDKNNDGHLDIDEFKAMLRGARCNCKLTDTQIEDFFVFLDGPQGDKRLTFEEFSKGLDIILAFLVELMMLFYEADTDKSGFLERNELKALLQKTERGKKLADAQIDAILKDADINGDNKISFDEFVAAIC